VILQSLDETGEATLIAESDGLRPATLKLKLTAGAPRPFLSSPVKADNTPWWDGLASRKAPGAVRKAAGSNSAAQDDYSFYEKNAVSNPKKAKKEQN
jgi:hypothetical protein